jgi:hypothetical protein
VREPAEPFRSSGSSFPYFAAGGIAYVAGTALAFAGFSASPFDLLEIGLLVAGSVLVVVGFASDARSRRKEPAD